MKFSTSLIAAAFAIILAPAVAAGQTAANASGDAALAARPHHVFLIGMLRITQPWIDVAGRGPEDLPGYLIVENRSAVPDRLLGATVKGATAVSIAGTGSEQGLLIPPHGRLTLQEGAAHLVLHGAQALDPQSGPIVATLQFERAGSLHLNFATDRDGAVRDDQSAPSTDDPPVDLAR